MCLTLSFTYNGADQPTTTGVAHDANGNMTSGGTHGYSAMTYNQQRAIHDFLSSR